MYKSEYWEKVGPTKEPNKARYVEVARGQVVGVETKRELVAGRS